MYNCLLTTLPSAVTDTSLPKLGELRIHTRAYSGSYAQIEKLGVNAAVTLTNVGGYFTNSAHSSNDGTSKSVTGNNNFIYFSNSDGYIIVPDKTKLISLNIENGSAYFALSDLIGSNISSLNLSNNFFTGRLSDLATLPFTYLWLQFEGVNSKPTGSLSDLNSFNAKTSLTDLILRGAKFTGSLADMPVIPTLSRLDLRNTSVTGDIAVIKTKTPNLRSLTLSNTGVTGSRSSLASMNLTTFNTDNTAVTD